MKTELFLRIGGLLHFCILIASALVPAKLNWKKHLAPLPPMMRQLFWIYGAFIVLVIVGFGTLASLHADSLASGTALARTICGFIALFWIGRLAIQLFVFDPTPYLANSVLKLGYHALTTVFIYFALVFGFAAIAT